MTPEQLPRVVYDWAFAITMCVMVASVALMMVSWFLRAAWQAVAHITNEQDKDKQEQGS